MDAPVLYEDDTIRLDDDGVVIMRYYFPIGRQKRIGYDEIVSVEVRPTGWTSKLRLWGSTNPFNWLPLDMRRPSKQQLVELDLGGRVKPVITPDDPDLVADLIHARI